MISPSILQELNQWLEGVEELPHVTDEERKQARKVLESAGLTLDRVERGGIRYALRKVIEILSKEESNEYSDPSQAPGSQGSEI